MVEDGERNTYGKSPCQQQHYDFLQIVVVFGSDKLSNQGFSCVCEAVCEIGEYVKRL